MTKKMIFGKGILVMLLMFVSTALWANVGATATNNAFNATLDEILADEQVVEALAKVSAANQAAAISAARAAASLTLETVRAPALSAANVAADGARATGGAVGGVAARVPGGRRAAEAATQRAMLAAAQDAAQIVFSGVRPVATTAVLTAIQVF